MWLHTVLGTFLIGICTGAPAFGQGLPLVVVDNTMDSRWLRQYQLGALERFELISEKDVSRRREALLKTRPIYQNKAGFVRATGYAYRLSGSGQTIKSGFVTVSHDKVFDQFVADYVSHLESVPELTGSVLVKRTGDRTVVSSPQYEQKIPGPPGRPPVVVRRKNQDLHLSYADGVIVFGQPPSPARSAELPPQKLKDRLKRAKGVTRYLSYMPGKAMTQNREAAMSLVLQAAAPRRQQRDNESDAEYRQRSFVAEELLKILRMAVLDVRELEGWTKWPRGDDSPFVAELNLTARKDSKLDKLLRRTRVATHSHTIQPNNFCTAQLQVELPEPLRKFLTAWVNRQGLGPVAQAIVSATLESKETVGSANLSAVDGGIRTTLQLDLPVRRLESADWLDQRTRSSDVTILNADFDEGMWATKSLKSGIVVSFGRDVPVPAELPEASEEKPESRARLGPVFELNADLSRYAGKDAGETERELMELIEELYVRGWVFRNHPSATAQRRRFKSLAGIGNSDGDWTAHVAVHVRGGTIRAKCRLGNALFTWLKLRTGFGF